MAFTLSAHSRVFSLILLATVPATAQTYRINTIAGFGAFGGDGGPATAALVNPAAVVAAADGTLSTSRTPVNGRYPAIHAALQASTRRWFSGPTASGYLSSPLTEGSVAQFDTLPKLPEVLINGASAQVSFAGVVGGGVYQLNVTIPEGAKDGDNAVVCNFGGSSVPMGTTISVQR
jgi:uncharacterized protein (TIGR03437 family)